MSYYIRKVKHHNGIKKIIQLVGNYMNGQSDEIPSGVKSSDELIVQVDAAHFKTIEDQHSI